VLEFMEIFIETAEIIGLFWFLTKIFCDNK
jgi:hypothetical protein